MANQSHTYSNLLDDAKHGVDGNSATCMKTYDIGVNSLIAAVWWIVDFGRVYRIQSINILFKNYDGYTVCDIAVYCLILFCSTKVIFGKV